MILRGFFKTTSGYDVKTNNCGDNFMYKKLGFRIPNFKNKNKFINLCILLGAQVKKDYIKGVNNYHFRYLFKLARYEITNKKTIEKIYEFIDLGVDVHKAILMGHCPIYTNKYTIGSRSIYNVGSDYDFIKTTAKNNKVFLFRLSKTKTINNLFPPDVTTNWLNIKVLIINNKIKEAEQLIKTYDAI